jgi:cell division protein FtsW
VAWTDSIFTVILEETGLLGGTFIILLYLVLIWRGYEISVNAPDTFGKLLAAGVTLWIGIEAFINIGVMVNIVPFAGNALPLISSGGSSLICTLAGIGILMSVSRSSAIEALKKERKTPDALIDLRGGNGGWRISSLGRGSRKR